MAEHYDNLVWNFINCFQVFLVRKLTGKEGGLIFAMKVLKKVSLVYSESEHLIYNNELQVCFLVIIKKHVTKLGQIKNIIFWPVFS